MRRISYLGFTAATFAALAMSCSQPVVNDAGNDDVTADTPMDAGPGQTLTFVLDQLLIDADDLPDHPHTGFNLDDYFSTEVDLLGCTHGDFTSQYDTDQNCPAVANERCTPNPNPGCVGTASGCMGGVDNQLPTLSSTIQTAAGTDLRATLQDTVATNKLSLIIRITGVNDFTTDSAVRVAIYRAYPTFSTGCTTVEANREYSVDRTFVTTGATSIESPAFAFDGSIVGGRLRITAGTGAGGAFNLPISLRGLTLNLPLHRLQVRANLTAAALANGSLGGWVAGQDVVDGVALIAPDYITVVQGVIGGLVDIQANGTCGDATATPPTFGGIGLGLGIHAVPATLTTTLVDAPATGTCGWSAPTDAGPRG